MRILFFGDGLWALDSTKRLLDDGHTLLGLILRTNPSDSCLEEVATEFSIPILQPVKVNANEFISAVSRLKPDLILSLSYNQILKKPLLDIPVFGAVNFHAGKLPYYRGRNVINWAILNGEEEIGITSHYMDEGIDTGSIILQRSIPISWTDTYKTVLNSVIKNMPDLASRTVSLISDEKVSPLIQEPGSGTYYGGREEGDEWLDWTDSSKNLHNKIRAISKPGPGARTLLGTNPIVIWKAHYDLSWSKYKAIPGQVVGRIPGQGVMIKTGDSMLLVSDIGGLGDKSRIPSWPIGTRLGFDRDKMLVSLLTKISDIENQLSLFKP